MSNDADHILDQTIFYDFSSYSKADNVL